MLDPALAGYWPGPWPCEDGGPRRTQASSRAARLDLQPSEVLKARSRPILIGCMTITRDPGEVYLLGHKGPPTDTTSWVERIDPESLAPVKTSPALDSGPLWPGGIAAHANGSLYVTYGRWCRRLDPDCQPVASRMLPRERPYNSLLVLPDGHLVMKDFAGGKGRHALPAELRGSELVVLEPERLEIVARYEMPEGSIARLSADVSDDSTPRIYVIGDTHAMRFEWNAERATLTEDEAWRTKYRTIEGQTFGWDAVIEDGFAWFLDNGEGTSAFGPSFTGKGASSAPLHLIRIPLHGGEPQMVEVCGKPGGIIANPPAIDSKRHIAVGYDSGHGIMTAWRLDANEPQQIWQREQHQAGHMVVFPETGELMSYDFDDTGGKGEHVVVLDIETGAEKGRVAINSPVQCVVFPSVGWNRDLYATTFASISRVYVE
ncbi:MAG: hypothetical protein ABI559_05610 [Chloroflexota bacterium]